MNARGIGPMTAWLLLVLTLVCAGGNDRADAFDRRHRDDTIEVRGGWRTGRLAAFPLGLVLGVIGGHGNLVSRGDVPMDGRVTASFRGVPLAEGLTRILKARSVVFIFSNDVLDEPY